jgi:glutamate 5-kinase
MKYSENQSCKLVFEIEEAPLLDSGGRLNRKQINRLAMILSDINNSGKQVILVTAGAIAGGIEKLKLINRPEQLPEKQALAAIGQVELIRIYQNSFDQFNQKVAQVLISRDILENEEGWNNAQNTFERLIEMNIIPIINENDTVSTDDIIYENNYPLSATVANLVRADLLILVDNGAGFRVYPANTNKFWRASDVTSLFKKINEIVDSPLRKPASGRLFPLTSEEMNNKIQEDFIVKIS